MTPTPGTRFGPYEILSAVGAGGMGEIYKARDTRLERDVAVKVLPAALTDSAPARERLQREARAVAALQHPNICTIYDVGETPDGQVFLVMELLQGETVQQRLIRGPLDVALIVDIGIAMADALDAAHRAGIVHRDVKPANILLTAHGPKLLDFGLAKAAPRFAADASTLPTLAPGPLLTEVGSTVGTVAYMSPEQLRGEDLDARTDLFSVGLVLYEIATGRPAFAGATSAVIAAAILHIEPRPPRELRADLPARLDEVILKALEKDRGLRHQRASELLADLRRLKRDADAARVPANAGRGVQPDTGRRWKMAVPAVAVLAACGVAGYLYVRRTPKLTDKDRIVLADFLNTTGDPVFDGTLRQGLEVQLEQSPFLSLISDRQIHRTLALMEQPADAKLTPEIAREICERSNSAAVLDGSIASLGTQYVLGLTARNCRTGEILDDQQASAVRKEEVLTALSHIAGNFRTRVGESLASIKEHQVPLVEATTASLDALEAYSAAQAVNFSKGPAAAVTLFKRAAALDPNFALAQAHLGAAYSGTGESILAIESLRKAYELRDRTSEPEKFFITVNYHRDVTGNLEKAMEAAELWTHVFPRDVRGHGFLSAFVTQGLGLYEKSIDHGRQAVAIEPDFIFGYTNPAWSYLYLNRPSDSAQVIDSASKRRLEPDEFLVLRYYDALLRGDTASMARQVTLARDRRGTEDWLTHARALVAVSSGHVLEARELTRHAVDLAERAGNHEAAATYQSAAAAYEALLGNAAAAKQRAAAALGVSNGRDVEYASAFALARTGESSRSETLADDLDRRFPEDTSVRFHYLPTLRALAALNAGKPETAATVLEPARRYELAMNGLSSFAFCGAMYPAYLRGEALLAAHKGAAAAAEFQKVIDHPGIVLADPLGALAVLQVGRAWAAAGDNGNAKTAYQDFLTRWKDADADIPILKEARTEFAKLQ